MKKIVTFIILMVIAITPLATSAAGVQLDNPLGSPDLAVLIQNIISAILGLVGVLALLSFIYGGLLWMTSLGAPAKVEKGKQVMLWAVYGLAIIFSSYAIITLIFTALGVKKGG